MKGFNAMQSIRIIVFLIFAHQFGTCDGQKKPLHSFPNFSNESVGHDFCALHRLIADGKIERRDVLRGIDLSIALFPYQLNAKTGAIDKENPDPAVVFLDELARRAGFQWKNKYGVIQVPKTNSNETYTDVLVWAGHAYDVVGEYFYRNHERVELGVLFSEGWVNADAIVVKTTDANKDDSSSFFNFLAPFTYGLWGLLGVTIIATGFVYYLIDYLDSKRDDRKQDFGFKESMFNAAWLFTGHSLHEPKSGAARLLVFAASFLCLLTVAAYTANLVSFLLPQSRDEIIINDVNDVIKYDLSCCIDRYDLTNEYMKKNYPTVRLVEIEDPAWADETYRSLSRSECDALITDSYMFKKRKGSSEYNPNCNLMAVATIYGSEGYFPVMDSPDRCTSLVSEVFTLHLLEMKHDKTYNTIWENIFSKSATVICEEAKEENEDTRKVSVANMFGIFVLYFSALLGAMLWSIIRFRCSPKTSAVQEFISVLRLSIYGNTSNTPRTTAVSNLESTREEIRAEEPLAICANFGQENPSSNDTRTEQIEVIGLQLKTFWDKLEERDNELMKRMKSMNDNNMQRFEENAKSINNNIQRFEEDVKYNIQRFEEDVKYNIQRFEENMSRQLQELQRRVSKIEKKQQ